MTKLELEFGARPSVPAYMLRALYPGFLRRASQFPPLRARWRAPPDRARLERFLGLTGLEARSGLPVLYPQVVTFPLQMAILTHPACPLPIWKVLQVRNQLVCHGQLPPDATLDAEASVAAQRIGERAMELDLRVAVRVRDELAWEGTTTYRYRGRFGAPGAPGAASPRADAEVGAVAEVARWRTGRTGGFGFGAISGDYNGIHYWDAYARRFGFEGALHHPHVIAGQCQARVPEVRAPAQRLDLWLKGPVYYGREVVLAAAGGDGGVDFTLQEDGKGRPALVGRWREATG